MKKIDVIEIELKDRSVTADRISEGSTSVVFGEATGNLKMDYAMWIRPESGFIESVTQAGLSDGQLRELIKALQDGSDIKLSFSVPA